MISCSHELSRASLIALALVCSSCTRAPLIDNDEVGDDDADNETAGSTLSTNSPSTDTEQETSTADESEGTPSDEASTSDTESGPLLDLPGDESTDSAETGTMPVPGVACMQDSDCVSGYCYLVPVLGGTCGECTQDSDCAGGCSPPNPLAGTGSACNEGQFGGGCESDDACEPGLTCELILDVAGILVNSTCSECGADAECQPGALCGLTVVIEDFAGSRSCIQPQSLALGSTCDLTGSGDEACASGYCAEFDVMGLVYIGVCSECEQDLDCNPGLSCATGSVDVMSGDIVPNLCQ